MKVKLTLKTLTNIKKEESYIIDNYDASFLPKNQKSPYTGMFDYFSKRLKEHGVNYEASYFDVNVNPNVVFDVKIVFGLFDNGEK